MTDWRKWHKYDIDSLYMIWFSKRLWPYVSRRNNCTPPSLPASWVIPASPYAVLYVYVLKPRSWQQDKHFLAVVLDIVHDKWRAVRVVGRALFSYSTWFFQVVLFLLLALFVCFLFWQPVHETQRERETVPYEVLINVCLTHTDAGLYSSKPPRKTENKPKPTRKTGHIAYSYLSGFTAINAIWTTCHRLFDI